MDGGLVLDKQVELGLGGRVPFEVDLEAMRGFQGALGVRVYGALDIAILCLMDCWEKVKVAFAVLLLPMYRSVLFSTVKDNEVHPLARSGTQPGCFARVLWTQNKLVPAIDGLALITAGREGRRFQPRES